MISVFVLVDSQRDTCVASMSMVAPPISSRACMRRARYRRLVRSGPFPSLCEHDVLGPRRCRSHRVEVPFLCAEFWSSRFPEAVPVAFHDLLVCQSEVRYPVVLHLDELILCTPYSCESLAPVLHEVQHVVLDVVSDAVLEPALHEPRFILEPALHVVQLDVPGLVVDPDLGSRLVSEPALLEVQPHVLGRVVESDLEFRPILSKVQPDLVFVAPVLHEAQHVASDVVLEPASHELHFVLEPALRDVPLDVPGVGVPQCPPEFTWNPDAVVFQPVHLESRLLVDGVRTGPVVDFRVQSGLVADFPCVLVQPDHHLESRLLVDGVQHGLVVDSSCGLGSRHLADEVQHGLVVDLPSAEILFLADVVGTIISPESGESIAQSSGVFAGVSGFFDPMFDVSVASIAAHSPGAQPHCELVLPQVHLVDGSRGSGGTQVKLDAIELNVAVSVSVLDRIADMVRSLDERVAAVESRAFSDVPILRPIIESLGHDGVPIVASSGDLVAGESYGCARSCGSMSTSAAAAVPCLLVSVPAAYSMLSMVCPQCGPLDRWNWVKILEALRKCRKCGEFRVTPCSADGIWRFPPVRIPLGFGALPCLSEQAWAALPNDFKKKAIEFAVGHPISQVEFGEAEFLWNMPVPELRALYHE